MGLLAQMSRLSGPTRDSPRYPSLRVQLVGYPWYQTSSLKEMQCLASPIHDALKSIEHSIIEQNQWVVMGPYE
jgi:hypothetical protein